MNERLGAGVSNRYPFPERSFNSRSANENPFRRLFRLNKMTPHLSPRIPSTGGPSRQFRGSARLPSGACKPRDEGFLADTCLTRTKTFPSSLEMGRRPSRCSPLLASERSLPHQGLVCSQLTCSCTCRGFPCRSENDRSSVPTVRCSFPTAGRDSTHRP